MKGFSAVVLFATFVATVKGNPLNPCTGAPFGAFIDDPTRCEGYFHCINGVPVPGTCPNELYFNPVNGLCDYKQNVDCKAVTEACKDKPQGTFIDNPGSCEGYYQCLNGVAVPGQCPNDFWFNPTTQVCEELRCTPSIPSGPPTVPPMPPPPHKDVDPSHKLKAEIPDVVHENV